MVNYEGTKYSGEIITVNDNNLEVNVMYPTAGRQYKWPKKEDKLKYMFSDVIKAIEPPVPCNSRASYFTFKDNF